LSKHLPALPHPSVDHTCQDHGEVDSSDGVDDSSSWTWEGATDTAVDDERPTIGSFDRSTATTESEVGTAWRGVHRQAKARRRRRKLGPFITEEEREDMVGTVDGWTGADANVEKRGTREKKRSREREREREGETNEE
jgi:hypothetical protein